MIALPRIAYPTTTRDTRKAAQGRLGSIVGLLDAWIERHRQRRALLALDNHMLKDIGLGQADVWQEARKPFWRA